MKYTYRHAGPNAWDVSKGKTLLPFARCTCEINAAMLCAALNSLTEDQISAARDAGIKATQGHWPAYTPKEAA
jgi:hypothetical protein